VYTGTSTAAWAAACHDPVGHCTAGSCVPSSAQGAVLWAFKESGGAANDAPLATWKGGYDPCGGTWAGVNCTAGNVTGLDLSDPKFKGVAGSITALAPLVELAYLDIESTGVDGDIKALAPLVKLTHLGLCGSQVDGDIRALVPLVDLTVLRLNYTNVVGDMQGLAPLTQLTYLDLTNTEVGGDVHALTALVQLTYLDLEDTTVVGCGVFCAAGGPFHAHCDPKHGAHGCSGCYC
jgi:hypothetical protein